MNSIRTFVVSIAATFLAAAATAQPTPLAPPIQPLAPLASAQSVQPRPTPRPRATPRPQVDVTEALEAAENALRDLDFAQGAPRQPLPPLPPKGLEDGAEALDDMGRDSIERGRFDRAVQNFDRVIEMKTRMTDAALYWKAYSLDRLGDRAKALTTLGELQKQFADSRWIKDAKALEVEVRQASGQAVSPDAQNNEELKLLALRGLMQNDPDQALPIIEKMLNGTDTPRVKEQALFVLSQSRVPRSREIIASIARGSANPDLQLRAIRYLGMLRASPELVAAYQADASPDVRRAVINSLAGQRDAATLVTLARAEKNPELKRDIVARLSQMKTKEATEYLLELLK